MPRGGIAHAMDITANFDPQTIARPSFAPAPRPPTAGLSG
jgi:hypothetical protein